MSVELALQPLLVEFGVDEREAWRAGVCPDDCRDPYCCGMALKPDYTGGFGEYIAGRHFERDGWHWLHHDFDIYGLNRRQKYESDSILLTALGSARLDEFKQLIKSLRPFYSGRGVPVVQPDLLLYSRDSRRIRFVECKRHDTGDTVDPRQAFGLFLIASQLHVPVDICILAESGKLQEPLKPLVFIWDESGVSRSG